MFSIRTINQSRGAYTLVNDVMYEWFCAFIKSFRKANPSLPLTVIPFDQQMARIATLKAEFHFDIMDETICRSYDALGKQIAPYMKPGLYRRFAAFTGPYEEFLFLDSDIVTLTPLDFLFAAFADSSAKLVYFDGSEDWCYNKKLTAEMVAKYGSRPYNAGAFLSRRDLFSEEDIFATTEKAVKVRDDFVPGVGDQSLLNFLTDTSRVKCMSLNELLPEYAPSCWARQPFSFDSETETAKDSAGRTVPFIHWAGCVYPLIARPEVFLKYRTLDDAPATRLGYKMVFYARQLKLKLGRLIARWKPVFDKFYTSSQWRKYYLGKLMGVDVEKGT